MTVLSPKSKLNSGTPFNWPTFILYTVVFLVVILTIKIVPQYFNEQYLFVKEGEYAQQVIKNVNRALANTAVDEVSQASLTPSITFGCGDYFIDGRETPFTAQSCPTDHGLLFLQTDGQTSVYQFSTVTLWQRGEITFAAQTKPQFNDDPSYTLRQEAVIQRYQAGEIREPAWVVEGWQSTIMIPVFTEAEAESIGAIMLKIEPPTGYWDMGFLLQVSSFYLPVALLLGFTIVKIQQSRNKSYK